MHLRQPLPLHPEQDRTIIPPSLTMPPPIQSEHLIPPTLRAYLDQDSARLLLLLLMVLTMRIPLEPPVINGSPHSPWFAYGRSPSSPLISSEQALLQAQAPNGQINLF